MGLLNDLKEAKEVAKNLKKEFDTSEEGQEIKKDLKQFIHEFFFGRPDQSLFKRLDAFFIPFILVVGALFYLHHYTAIFGYSEANAARLAPITPWVIMAVNNTNPSTEKSLLDMTKTNFIFGPGRFDIDLLKGGAKTDGTWEQTVQNTSDYFVAIKVKAHGRVEATHKVEDIRYTLIPPNSSIRIKGIFNTKGGKLTSFDPEETELEFVKEYDMEQALENIKHNLNKLDKK